MRGGRGTQCQGSSNSVLPGFLAPKWGIRGALQCSKSGARVDIAWCLRGAPRVFCVYLGLHQGSWCSMSGWGFPFPGFGLKWGTRWVRSSSTGAGYSHRCRNGSGGYSHRCRSGSGGYSNRCKSGIGGHSCQCRSGSGPLTPMQEWERGARVGAGLGGALGSRVHSQCRVQNGL